MSSSTRTHLWVSHTSLDLTAKTLLSYLLLCFIPLLAFAQTTAVLGVGGNGTSAFRGEVTDLLIASVENNHALELVDRHDLPTDEAMGLLGCSVPDAGCLLELSQTLEVDQVLCALISGDPGALEINLHYYDSQAEDYLLEQTSPYQTEEDRILVEMRLGAVVSNRTVIRITSENEAAVVLVNGTEMGTAPVVIYDLEEGTHTFTTICDGCESSMKQMQIVSGRSYSETITPTLVEVVTSSLESDDDGPSLLLPGLMTVVGTTLIGTGVGFGIRTRNLQNDYNVTPSYDEAMTLADQGEKSALLTNIFIIGGAAVALTGALLFFTGGDEDSSDSTGDTASTLSPWITEQGGWGLGWGFRY